MSAMAVQKAGPNRLNFVEGTQGYPGGNIGKKGLYSRWILKKKISRATLDTSAS